MVTTRQKSRFFGFHTWVLVGALAGIVCGYWPLPAQRDVAQTVLGLFSNVLNLVSLPTIFLALFTTLCGAQSFEQLKWMGGKVVMYTLSTTLVAASVALGLYLWMLPAAPALVALVAPTAPAETQVGLSYIAHLTGLVPRHVFAPFMESNIIGVLLMAVALGLAMVSVPQRAVVYDVGHALLQALMKIIRVVCWSIPAVVWAGVVVSFSELSQGDTVAGLARYLVCVVLANVVQACVVLPLFLRWHGINPWATWRGLAPALEVAFFSKSSVATIPVAIRCAEDNLQVHPKVARFTFPICTTINMNACAAFILITVLFVASSHGRMFAPWELAAWVGVATLAAVGNAGVPMGCYFLASAFLAAMGVPATKMALILPFYSVLDMLETAVNVWSDGCVAVMVDRKYRRTVHAAPICADQAA